MKLWNLVPTKSCCRCHKSILRRCLLCSRKVSIWLRSMRTVSIWLWSTVVNPNITTKNITTKQRDSKRRIKKSSLPDGKCQSLTLITCSECLTISIRSSVSKENLMINTISENKPRRRICFPQQIGLLIKIFKETYYTYFDLN